MKVKVKEKKTYLCILFADDIHSTEIVSCFVVIIDLGFVWKIWGIAWCCGVRCSAHVQYSTSVHLGGGLV